MGPFSRVSSSVYPFRSSDSSDPMFVCRPFISLALILLFSQPPFDHLLAIVATATRIGRFEGQLISRSSHQDYFPPKIFFHPAFVFSSVHASPRQLLFINLSVHGIYLHASVADETRGNRSFFSLFNLLSCPVSFVSF